MDETPELTNDRWDPEPRWPALIAILAVACLYVALPRYLIIGPHWLFPAIVLVLLVPTVISHRRGRHRMDRIFGFTVSGVVTLGLIASVILLIHALPSRKQTPTELLHSAALVWLTNILVFALWYWRLDAGGPHGRDKRFGHPDGAFYFPQMAMTLETKIEAGEHGWSPNFVDYLFIAFNTNTAFSPTDAPVLARWAKLLTMVQSFISLAILALLAARAVNIL
jgi:hypothetical protein